LQPDAAHGHALAEVRTLVGRGDMKQALKRLESARRSALADEEISALTDVLAECRMVHARADQKRRNEAVRVMNAAKQNIRFLSRKQALAAGQEWIDPFQVSLPAKPDQVTAREKRDPIRGDGFTSADASTNPQYAAWSERFRAWLLDMAILVGVFLVVGVALSFISQAIFPAGPGVDVGSGVGALLVLPFVLLFPAYLAICHGRARGQTPGKRAVGIAVRHASTLDRISYLRAFSRAYLTLVFWLLYAIPGIVDALWPLWDSKREALHDKIARTVVIRV